MVGTEGSISLLGKLFNLLLKGEKVFESRICLRTFNDIKKQFYSSNDEFQDQYKNKFTIFFESINKLQIIRQLSSMNFNLEAVFEIENMLAKNKFHKNKVIKTFSKNKNSKIILPKHIFNKIYDKPVSFDDLQFIPEEVFDIYFECLQKISVCLEEFDIKEIKSNLNIVPKNLCWHFFPDLFNESVNVATTIDTYFTTNNFQKGIFNIENEADYYKINNLYKNRKSIQDKFNNIQPLAFIEQDHKICIDPNKISDKAIYNKSIIIYIY